MDMVESVAHVATPQPARYVKQLVSHLGHKLTTEVDEAGAGVITLDVGRCTLDPQPGVLVLVASATDQTALAQVQDVVGRHLVRFGDREGLTVTWSVPA
jgi:caffeoyl-CoA O-methyltransferase